MPLIVWMVLSALVFVTLEYASARAQQEVDPDHFDSASTEPAPRLKDADGNVKAARFDGNFSLPYAVRCRGKKLSPGKYSILLRSDGRVAHGVLKSGAQAIEIASVVHTQAPSRINDVVVESKQNMRTLSAIRIAGLVFVFDTSAADSSELTKNRRVDILPLTVSVSKTSLNAADP